MNSKRKRIRYNKIHERDGYKCFYCGLQMSKENEKLTIEHLIRPNGLKEGKNSYENLVTSCFDCNNGRSNWFTKPIMDKSVLVYLDYLKNETKDNT